MHFFAMKSDPDNSTFLSRYSLHKRTKSSPKALPHLPRHRIQEYNMPSSAAASAHVPRRQPP